MSNFKEHTRKICNEVDIHLLNIPIIDDKIEELIEKYITSICYSPEYITDIKTVKKELKRSLENIKNTTLYMGRIAEFFIHLYLNNNGYKQQCLFTNLEEDNSIKKGFDGYYSFKDEEWIVESKSGDFNEEGGNTHKNKIHLAYTDLEHKFSGKSKDNNGNPINPWQNAWNHAKIVGAEKDITSSINKLSENFKNGIFSEISNYNIIPASTIFLNSQSCDNKSIIDNPTILSEIEIWLKEKKYKKIFILCITQNTKDAFLEYLNR